MTARGWRIPLGASAIALVAASQLPAQDVVCELRRQSDTVFAGECRQGPTVVYPLTLRQPAPAGVVWHGSAPGMRGFFNVNLTKDDATVRTVEVWYPITRSQLTQDSLSFAYAQTAARATATDLRILEAALALLSDSTKWHRADDGEVPAVQCRDQPTSRSLFCALQDASMAMDGEPLWGRAATNLVRDAIRARAASSYQHWLTGYNRDPSTTFADIRAVFEQAIGRVRRDLGGRN